MPRKPKPQKRETTVIVNNVPITVTLFPPSGARTSWYVYWSGLITSKSTGQRNYDDAAIAAKAMLEHGGKKPTLEDAILSDEELMAIQRRHFSHKTDPKAQARAAKTLKDCLEAINAFKSITGLSTIASATADDCAKFQIEAQKLPKNWRHQQPPRDGVRRAAELISPNTILKWSRQLHASFDRANRNAGKKCVRGVVDERKLLSSNPWNEFMGIEGRDLPLRQFDNEELLSLMTYFETRWREVTVAATAAKVFLWSACRRMEVASLTWNSLRHFENEYHFEFIGKRGVKRWFRVPETVYQELFSLRTNSPFVFAAYSDQLRVVHATEPNWLQNVRPVFAPENFGQWFYKKIVEWSEVQGKAHAVTHTYRKSGLQHARRGEYVNRQVAKDAGVSEAVMTGNYTEESPEELIAKSNNTYFRILAGLSPEVALRYGQVKNGESALEKQLQAAIASKNWELVSDITAKLKNEHAPDVG